MCQNTQVFTVLRLLYHSFSVTPLVKVTTGKVHVQKAEGRDVRNTENFLEEVLKGRLLKRKTSQGDKILERILNFP